MKFILQGMAVIIAITALILTGCPKVDDTEPEDTSSKKTPKVDTSVTFNNLTADGSSVATTTKLILTFDKDITGLSASDITFNGGSTGAAKGNLTRTGTGAYELAVTGINIGGSVTVSVSKSGYNITNGTRTVTVYYKIIAFNVDQIPPQTYTGNPITPAVTVKNGTVSLTLNTDYTVIYANNTNAGTASVTITGIGGYTGISGSAIFTINKANGAAVSAPTLNGAPTLNSVTVNAITLSTGTGQSVEYGISASNNANTAAWQTSLIFNSLNAGTTYYIFARSVSNQNYNTGAASSSLSVTTPQTVSKNRFEYYWVDEHDSLVTTSGGETNITAGSILTITAQSTGYTVKQWYLNGFNTNQSGNTYNFSSITPGKHTVVLLVEKNSKLYNTNIVITVVGE